MGRFIIILRCQRGAAAVEAFFALSVLLLLLVVTVNIGAGFWNLSVLTNASQSATLTSQFLIDSSCSPNRPGTVACSNAKKSAATQVDRLIDKADDNLLLLGCSGSDDRRVVPRDTEMTENGRLVVKGALCTRPKPDNATVVLPSTEGVTLPNGTELGPGWGYSSIALSAPFRFWFGNAVGQGSEIRLAGGSLTATYKPYLQVEE
jgi:hypothetical protein